jgi:hypothetical protein
MWSFILQLLPSSAFAFPCFGPATPTSRNSLAAQMITVLAFPTPKRFQNLGGSSVGRLSLGSAHPVAVWNRLPR